MATAEQQQAITDQDELLFPGTPPSAGDEVVGEVRQPRGPGQRIWERFWGTDIEKDPQQWTRLGTTISGAILGGSLGSRFPLNPIAGALIGGAMGAAGGAMAPEAVMEIGETIGVLPKGYRDTHGLSPRDLTTVMEGEALLDLATGGGIFAARLMGRLATRVFVKPGQVGEELAQIALKNNVAVLPVMVGQRRLPRQMVSVFGRFPFLFSPLSKQAKVANDQLLRAYETLPTRIAPMAAMSDAAVDMMTKEAQGFALSLDKTFREQYAGLFLKADQAGVRVTPSATVGRARDTLAYIARTSPKGAKGEILTKGGPLEGVQKFITTNILPMQMVDEASGAVATANQSLGSMDTLLTKIEDQAAAFYKAGNQEAYNAMGDLKQQVLLDMQMNSKGKGATAILQEYQQLDQAYSQTWQELFENGVAKKFGINRRRGVRGVTITDVKAIPVDRLAESIMRIGDPNAVDQLANLVTKETFQRVTASVLDAKIASAFDFAPDGSKVLNLNLTGDSANFAHAMGLDKPGSPLYQTMSKMLDRAGGLSMKEVEDLTKLTAAVASVEIPNVSTFLARRAGIGGINAAVKALIPGAVAGASSGGVAAGVMGTGMSVTGLVAGLTFVGGNRLIAKMISNPASAQALRRVMGKESKDMVYRAYVAKVGRMVIWADMQDRINAAADDGGIYNRNATAEIRAIREEAMQSLDMLDTFLDSWYTEGQRELRKVFGSGDQSNE